jgi:hypothetical protein
MRVMETAAAPPLPAPPLQRIARVFEQLRADQLDVLAQVYAPRFGVSEVTGQGNVGWMTWDFHFPLRKGASAQGAVGATAPVLGVVVRRLKRAAATG